MSGAEAHGGRLGRLLERRNLLAWGVLLVSLCTVLLAWNNLRQSQARAAQQQFDLLTKEVSEAIRGRMIDHEKILLGAAALLDASREVTRADWHTYIARLQLARHYPGIQGVGFSQVLRPEERAPFEARVRREGFLNFFVRPLGERAQYSSIIFLEPFSGRNLASFGYDMLSEPTRRAAMLAAAASGETQLSGKVTLLQETHGAVQPGLLMYVPVYRAGLPLGSPGERLRALRGFVFSPYRMHDLMTGILGNTPRELSFELYAGRAEAPEQLLFSSNPGDAWPAAPDSRQLLELYGQHWTLNFRPAPAFSAGFEQGQGPLLALGICISLLLFFLVDSLSRRREQAQGLAKRMTEQLRQQKQHLRRSEERLALALKGSNDGWWDLDLRADTFYSSPRGWQMLGYPDDGLAGGTRSWERLVHAEDLEQARGTLDHALRQGETYFNFECRLLHCAGHAVPVLLRGYIQRDERGRPLRVSGTTMDLTEGKRIERMKSEFVSTVSHELRTPLTSIAGSLGLIRGGALGSVPQPMQQMLEIAHHNSLRLSHLINDLLDMDKLVAGKMTFDLQRHELKDLLADALASNQAYAEQHGVQLVQDACPPLRVRADALRVQQVLANFLSNAIKFSPRGAQVRLSCTARGQRVRINVSDQGPGVPADFQERIFQKFSQADATDSRQKGGTGLGLAISKELIERMGGQIGFDSRPGQGCTFWCELPLPATNDTQAAAAPSNPQSLLVVEDDADTAYLLQQMLGQAGYRVLVAGSLAEARALLASQQFAALTLDLSLSDGSGLELIHELRTAPATQALPVLVISASSEQGRLSLNGTFQAIDWLDKPIDRRHLLHSLQQALQGLPERARVLHVEDDADLRQVIAEQGRGLADFIAAGNLTEARRHLADSDFDLILLDIGLPDGNGLELLEELHRHHPGLPVVVLSAQELPAEQLGQVEAALAKSRTNAQHFLGLLGRLLPAKENRHA